MNAVIVMQLASVKSLATWVDQKGRSKRVGRMLSLHNTCLSDPPDVLHSRLFIKAEIFIKTKPDVVAIQAVRKLALMQQSLFQGTGDGGLMKRSIK